MLSIFKKLFGKPEPKAVAPAAQAVPAPTSTPIPTIEVAHLSLAAVVERFPEELKPLLMATPDANATVALPIPTILKQLPLGIVKMSLASLHRQAHGLIKPLPPGDKRSVEIPLAEIFRHVRMELLRRRPDQRQIELPETGFSLFGDAANPYAISPDAEPEPEPLVLDLTPDMPPPSTIEPPRSSIETPRVLKMDDGLKAHFANGAAAKASENLGEGQTPGVAAPRPSGIAAPKPSGIVVPKRSVSGPQVTPLPHAPAPLVPVVEKPSGPTLPLPIRSLYGNWPDEVRAEIDALDPATNITLPVEDVTSRLAKGRVAYSWAQIRAWLDPECTAPSAVAADTVLQLPLKVVAPAFLSASKKPAAERKTAAMDESIPALFTDGRPPQEAPPAAPAAEAPAAPAPEPAAPAPAVSAAPAPEQIPLPPPPSDKLPENVGEIFRQPNKEIWTPAEIVAGTVTLAGVAGAIVALQEGLVVSASLPDGVKSDVVAAFLPQIFARLNQYAGEMRLGDVDDLLFTTHGAHCQIYRLGYIYFAVLGKAGESLPWHELRLISEELARQTHK